MPLAKKKKSLCQSSIFWVVIFYYPSRSSQTFFNDAIQKMYFFILLRILHGKNKFYSVGVWFMEVVLDLIKERSCIFSTLCQKNNFTVPFTLKGLCEFYFSCIFKYWKNIIKQSHSLLICTLWNNRCYKVSWGQNKLPKLNTSFLITLEHIFCQMF